MSARAKKRNQEKFKHLQDVADTALLIDEEWTEEEKLDPNAEAAMTAHRIAAQVLRRSQEEQAEKKREEEERRQQEEEAR